MLKFIGFSYDPIPSFVKVNFNATSSKVKIWPIAIRRNHKREFIFVWTEIIKDQDLLITKTKVAHSAKKKKNKVAHVVVAKVAKLGITHVICKIDTLNVIQPLKSIMTSLHCFIVNIIDLGQFWNPLLIGL